MSWRRMVLSLEFRKALSYRVDFWLNFVGVVVVHICAAYFLWKAIFEVNQLQEIGGYKFEALMFYYFLVPFVERITHAQMDSGTSREIYDGSFNKYLIYPVDLISYKFMSHIGYGSVTILQIAFASAIVLPIFGIPVDVTITPLGVIAFVPLVLLSSYVIFILMFCLELVAFWADTVWSLHVMLRLSIQLFGGILLPIEVFPASFQGVLYMLPFQFGSSLPVRCLMGKLNSTEIINAYMIGIFWAAVGTLVAYAIFRKGLRGYTGVGI